MPVIVADDIGKTAGGKRILSHVGFEVGEGEIFGVLGPNASGKTTLLRIVGTMLLPDEGKCEVFGMDVVKRDRAVRRLLGFVSPELNYHDRFTAAEIANFYRRVAGVDVERVREIVKKCGVSNIWNKWWGYLSYGERVILTVAVALGRHPKLLLLDEPTANLDVANRIVLSDLMIEEGIVSLVATHDMSFARKTIDRCIVLNEGRIVLSGGVDDLIKKLKFKTAIEASFGSNQSDKTLNSLCNSYRRKPDSSDVTFYVQKDEDKIDILRDLVKMSSLTGVTMSEPSVEDLIFWAKSQNAQAEKDECAPRSRSN
ncbi:MAG: ABC transporter ATP-binding protein [Promethearchaeati archaeon SRVP18_Atabeyarchaeia-1]